MSWFDEIITPDERKELEAAIWAINVKLLAGRLVAEHITQLIDQKFGF